MTRDNETPIIRKSGFSLLSGIIASPWGAALFALVLVLALGMVFNADGAFFKIGTHRDSLRQASVYGILAIGMTMVIISGGIDLSVGSVLGATAVLFSLMSIHWGWNPVISIILCLLFGSAIGAISGSLVAFFKVQPFIATLAMMSFARGIAKIISGGIKVSTVVPLSDGTFRQADVPQIFRMIDSRVFGGNLTVVSLIFLFCLIIFFVILSYHRWGRQLFAIGGNEEAARLSGVPVRFTKLIAYVSGGLLSAVAGLCQAAQEQQGDPEAGTTYELMAIAMVVIGGTSLMGGRGGLVLTLIGVLVMGYLDKILSINAVPEAWRFMLTGVVIILAVLIQGRKQKY